MVDANYSMTVKQAKETANAFEEFNLLQFEEPIEPDNFLGYSEINNNLKVLLAMGENLHSLKEFDYAFKYSVLTCIQADASNCGGITNLLKVTNKAKAMNSNVSSNGVQELHVSLVSSSTDFCWIAMNSFTSENYTLSSVYLEDGLAIAQENYGIEVIFNWNKLRKNSK